MTKVAKAKLNTNGLKKLDDNITRALIMTASKLQDEIRESMVIPRDLGTLQGDAFSIDDTQAKNGIVNLVNDTPYARRLYYHPEYNFQTVSWVDENGKQHGGNVNAQGMWFTLWEQGGYYEKRPQEIFADVLRQIMGEE